MNLRLKILNFMLPVSKAIARLHMPYTRKKINWHIGIDAIKVLEPGCVIITTTYGELANIFIPGEFSHAGIVYFDKGVPFVIEAKTSGVCMTHFMEFMMGKDEAVILKPLFCDSNAMKYASTVCYGMVGSPYDFFFDPSTKAFYCAELASYGYSMYPKWSKRKTMGVDTIIPDDFYKSAMSKTPKWESLWDSEELYKIIDELKNKPM